MKKSQNLIPHHSLIPSWLNSITHVNPTRVSSNLLEENWSSIYVGVGRPAGITLEGGGKTSSTVTPERTLQTTSRRQQAAAGTQEVVEFCVRCTDFLSHRRGMLLCRVSVRTSGEKLEASVHTGTGCFYIKITIGMTRIPSGVWLEVQYSSHQRSSVQNDQLVCQFEFWFPDNDIIEWMHLIGQGIRNASLGMILIGSECVCQGNRWGAHHASEIPEATKRTSTFTIYMPIIIIPITISQLY